MSGPWVELIPPQDQEDIAGPGFSEYQWQALFACQIVVPKHHEWINLRWGFNASILFDEAMKRQNLLLESQHGINNELRIERPNRQTLTFRYINLPNKGLLLVVLGKIYAKSKNDAEEFALGYYRGLKATFPYDFKLVPADTEDDFHRLSGRDILTEKIDHLYVAQIKRQELPILINQKSPFLQGLWRSSPHAHEQIWRSIAALPYPVLINIMLRSTVIYDNELQTLLKSAEEIAGIKIPSLNQKVLKMYKEWNENFVNRRQDPWQKFFYLQIHLASNHEIDENLIRSVGTSLTLSSEGHTNPGYQVKFPAPDEKQGWGGKIRNLDLVFSDSNLSVPRLSEVADLEEVYSAVRIPYSPPEGESLGFRYLPTKSE